MLIVYFSSKSENTHKFVEKLGLPSVRIQGDQTIEINEPYILIFPSYGGGEIKGSVPLPVIKFLNNEKNRSFIKGVVASGNTNFGTMYCYGGKVVAKKCGVPLLYRFELMGNEEDVLKVKNGVINLGKK